jgi:hypothetical protein
MPCRHSPVVTCEKTRGFTTNNSNAPNPNLPPIVNAAKNYELASDKSRSSVAMSAFPPGNESPHAADVASSIPIARVRREERSVGISREDASRSGRRRMGLLLISPTA